jgi:hypothetical protein
MKRPSDVGRYFVILVCLAPVYVLGSSVVSGLAFDARQGHALRLWNVYLFYLVQCFVFGALAWGIATKRTWARYTSAIILALIAVGAGWAAVFPIEGLGRTIPVAAAFISVVTFIWLVRPGARSEFQTADGKS